MRFQSVIFDMDGTLIDSELYFLELEMKFLEKYKIDYTDTLRNDLVGKSWRDTVTLLKEQHRLSPSVPELLDEKLLMSKGIHAFQAQKMPGADELLTRLKSAGYKLAIASGSPLERVETIMDRMGWYSLFDAFVSVEQVDKKGKPDPAVYTRVIRDLDVLPLECVAIEDSVNGVRAAKAAGAACAAVLDPRWSFGDYSEADLVTSSLTDKQLWNYLGLE